MRLKSYCVGTVAGLGLTVAASSPAWAYLDPGTGSIILQVLLGGAAGGLVIVKLYWHRIKAMFGRGTAAPEGAGEDAAAARETGASDDAP